MHIFSNRTGMSKYYTEAHLSSFWVTEELLTKTRKHFRTEKWEKSRRDWEEWIGRCIYANRNAERLLPWAAANPKGKLRKHSSCKCGLRQVAWRHQEKTSGHNQTNENMELMTDQSLSSLSYTCSCSLFAAKPLEAGIASESKFK